MQWGFSATFSSPWNRMGVHYQLRKIAPVQFVSYRCSQRFERCEEESYLLSMFAAGKVCSVCA